MTDTVLINRETLEQTLYALEYHQDQTRPIPTTEEAIQALRAALAAPADVGVSLPPMTCPMSKRSNCALYGERPSKHWYESKIKETLDDDFAIGPAAVIAQGTKPETVYPAQSSGKPSTARDETGWLIEMNKGTDHPCWLMANARYTNDANEAFRFARQCDAEAFLKIFFSAKFGDDTIGIYKRHFSERSYSVTEHMWPATVSNFGSLDHGAWRWVPTEPTEAMLQVAIDESPTIIREHYARTGHYTGRVATLSTAMFADVYRAMLAAAPSTRLADTQGPDKGTV